MGNRVARLATPCFAAARGDGGDDNRQGDARNGGVDDGGSSSSIGHILSFDGRDGRAKGIGAIHGVLLPSNQSTIGSSAGGSLLNFDQASFSGSSSFDSSNSFSFRTLQPGQYSGPLESTSSSGMSVARHGGPRTDEQILADLKATRRRRQCQVASSRSPLLGGLRRAVASALRASPCVSPARDRDSGETSAPAANGCEGGAIVGNGNATDEEARVQWARGKAGEDRVHVVVSEEEHGWTFVGIYDGFNGPDATDYLAANLYAAVCRELTSSGVATVVAEEDDGDSEHPPRHDAVLGALARALHATEAGYFAEAEARATECPELAMMGSCVLVALMKGADVYVMNVGDSRAVLAQQQAEEQFDMAGEQQLGALQLTVDHSTNAYNEVRRIQSEHLDDPSCVAHGGRVKGALKVTRAFGAGYLKDPRWNAALLEVFRVDYVGTAPYVTCRAHLQHHRIGARDRFMILSSDGLYDYFTNEEVVAQVEEFTARYPGEDPAKYLSHEILRRAANQAGMEIHELLEVQQGDRRRYHDDVSIIIISLEGKIWRS